MKIQPERALILWQETGIIGGMIEDVFVCDLGKQPKISRSYENSAGACSIDWLRGPWHETPMGIFLCLSVKGFRSRGARAQSLREFAKIEGQQWALDLLAALGEIYIAYDNEIYERH